MAMKAKLGQYYYTPRGNGWRIYRYTHVSDTGFSGSAVTDEPTYFNREEAKKRVYELNGWKYRAQEK